MVKISLVTKDFTFSAGATIIASEHNTNFDILYTLVNANIDNANIKSSAAIAGSKLDLSALTQAVSIANDVTLGGGANHELIFNFEDGITFTPAVTWTFSAAQTVSGTWADLGTVTTVDINGGTLNGMNVLGLSETTARTTAAGEGALYTKDTGGQPELFYREESNGDEIQITSAGSGLAKSAEIFTEDGTFTAPAGIAKVYLTMVSGGGGGGGGASGNNAAGGGGGGGQTIINFPYTVVAGNDYTVTVNDGGTAGSVGSGGGTGGSVVFDALTLTGGAGGDAGSGASTDGDGGLGAGGVESGDGDITSHSTVAGVGTIKGGNGSAGSAGAAGGGGGGTPFGAGGTGDSGAGDAAADNTGGGGAGGNGTAAGGAGGSGKIIVMY